jgi:hypothetical protein
MDGSRLYDLNGNQTGVLRGRTVYDLHGNRHWIIDRDALLDVRGRVIGYLGESVSPAHR